MLNSWVVPWATQIVAPPSSASAFTLELLGHHEALAVIEIDAGVLEAEPGIALAA